MASCFILEFALQLRVGGIFVLDDNPTIVENLQLQQSFVDAIASSPFRAVSFAVNWATYVLFGLNPTSFHIINIMLHIVASYSLFLLVKELSDNKNRIAAVFASCWFLLNPVTNFSVLYITARSAILASIFTMIALIAYFHFERSGKIQYLIFSVSAAICALLSKESGIAAPALIVSMGCMTKARNRWIKASIPAIVIMILYVVFRSRHLIYLGPQTALLSRLDYLATQSTVIPMYFADLLWPRLLPLEIAVTTRRSIFDPAVIAAAISIFAAWTGSLYLFKNNRAAIFLLIWMPMTFAPESSFIPLVDVAFYHRVYMPAAAAAAIVGFALAKAASSSTPWKNRAAYSAMAIILVCIAVSNFNLAASWKTKIDLHRLSVRASPDKFRARYDLGVSLSKAKEYRLALPHLGMAAQIGGSDDIEQAQALNALGKALFRTGNMEGALMNFRKALQLQPEWNDPIYNIGMTSLFMERPKEAYIYLTRAKAMMHPSAQLDKAIESAKQLMGSETNPNHTIEIPPP